MVAIWLGAHFWSLALRCNQCELRRMGVRIDLVDGGLGSAFHLLPSDRSRRWTTGVNDVSSAFPFWFLAAAAPPSLSLSASLESMSLTLLPSRSRLNVALKVANICMSVDATSWSTL